MSGCRAWLQRGMRRPVGLFSCGDLVVGSAVFRSGRKNEESRWRRITSACSGPVKVSRICEAQNARHFAVPLMRGVRLHVNDWAITHFEKLTRLLAEFSNERIELLEHRYHPTAFGSFVLVLAKGHQQLKFEWDGKESILAL